MCIWRQCNKDPSAALGMTVLGERIGSQGWCAAFLEEGILVSQPSPLGEGAPQGRIGHKRHERQMRKAERCSAHVGADERSEAGLVSPNEGVAFHAANLRPFGAPPSKGRREGERGAACIVIGIFAAKPPPEP